MGFWTNAAERMRIDSSGNVGIGTSPSYGRLHIFDNNSDIDMSANAHGQLHIDGNAYGFGIALNANGANLYTNSVSRNLIFGVNETEVMRVTYDSVGIGTASPAAQLDVVGTVRVTNTVNASNNSNLRDGGGLVIEAGNSNPIYFYTGGSEKARINSTGDLLLNTTTFGVQDAGNISTDSNQGRLYLNATGSSGLLFLNQSYNDTAARYQILFYRREAFVGSITSSTTATAYNTSSDYRLKEDWQPMSGSVDRVKALNPVNFAWKADGSRVDGFLAHEAQTVVPEAVTGTHNEVDDEGNPVYQGIDQSKLVPLLTAALQEAITKIETLEARVTALES